MANIEKRQSPSGKTTYRAKVRLKGFPTQSATFERLTDAKRWAQNTESAIREGRHFKTVEAKRRTLAEAIDRYTEHVLPAAPANARNTKRHLHWWKKSIGARLLADVSPALIGEYRDKLALEQLNPAAADPPKYRSNSTVTRYLASLSVVLTRASREWGWLDESPMRKVTKPKQPRGRVRYLSDEERARLLAACKVSAYPQLHLIVVLAISTGMRLGEIMALRWSQVDFQQNRIILHTTKNGDIRAVPLASEALDLLKKHTKVRSITNDLLFPGRKPNCPRNIRKPWQAALKAAEIPDFRFHDLRHCTASYLAMNGATLAEISEILGHKTLQMVKRYAHISPQHSYQVVASMNERIFGKERLNA